MPVKEKAGEKGSESQELEGQTEESHGSYYIYSLATTTIFSSLIVSLYFISSLRVWPVRQLQYTSIISLS